MIQMFLPRAYAGSIEGNTYHSQAPSNIALVKYWGKLQGQIPANPSVSFALTDCYTDTSVKVSAKQNPEQVYDFDFFFEGKRKEAFYPKLLNFFEKVESYLPFIKEYHFEIHSLNSFPHSSGIASSASAMAALSLCFMQMERDLQEAMPEDFFYKKASFLARLGSGSACRSVQGSVVVWGEHADIEGSSNLYGVAYPKPIHRIFEGYRDTILLIDKGQKQVSSTQGHNLMHNHPYAGQRFKQASEHISALMPIFEGGDVEAFIHLVELEALTLHAMMLTSSPYFILMKPNTLSAIEKIWDFRRQTHTPVGFTLDAGANIHLLYPSAYDDKVLPFIASELSGLCEQGQYITDRVR